VGLAYVGNPKHKQPWQPGRKGSVCPPAVDGGALLRDSVVDSWKPRSRWATDGRDAYEAKNSNVVDSSGDEVWHGHPVPWSRVPPRVRKAWQSEGRLSRHVPGRGRG